MAAKFDMPGQTKELPPNAADTEALITFYESLYQQRPDSKMAADFLLKHGLLEYDVAEDLHKKMLKQAGKSAIACLCKGVDKDGHARRQRAHALFKLIR